MFNFPMNNGKNIDNSKFYQILGIEKDANENQIKKAYRKLAMKFHPDRNPDNPEAEEKFKHITDAYSVLSDPEKKKLYDQYGEEAIKGDNANRHNSAKAMFEHLFGQNQEESEMKIPPTVDEIYLDLEDFYEGRIINKTFTKDVIFNTKTGRTNKFGFKVCPDCEGRGFNNILRQLGPGMVQQMQAPCETCNRKGFVLKTNNIIKKVNDSIEIRVEPGEMNGEKKIFSKKGNFNYLKQEYADLLIILKQKPHNKFERRGKDLIFKKTVTIWESLCLNEFTMEHLDGRKLVFKSDDVIKPNTIKTIKYEGMPIPNNNVLKGNLIVVFDVTFPEKISDDQKQGIKDIFKIKDLEIDDSFVKVNIDDLNHDDEVESDDDIPQQGFGGPSPFPNGHPFGRGSPFSQGPPFGQGMPFPPGEGDGPEVGCAQQ